ncbi:reverse transcriptase domain-containing protein [Desulfobacter latus]|uniref:reverse transcriptase domain-containing protein n=1 Tax=Desulfobacter latus TaxID=2292 RepID=UPI0024835200|nr:reverse transcriptase domain-containing protein [Desulfobacter latus]
MRRPTRKGGPLSPLLSNIVLDELDKELEKRGHRYVRYADDPRIFCKSAKAAERVMQSITRFLTVKLKLKVNKDKSAVSRPWIGDHLGFHPSFPEVLLLFRVKRICVAFDFDVPLDMYAVSFDEFVCSIVAVFVFDKR